MICHFISAVSIRSGVDDQPDDPQLIRLDNMLVNPFSTFSINVQ